MSRAITVSQLNRYIKDVIDSQQVLNNIFIVGEISNFLHYCKSGHMYFTLKDSQSQLKSVMFASFAQKLKFIPEDGIKVICRGRVSVYEKDGAYQLYVEDMQPDGLGSLNLAYEQLKEKLSKEGLFDDIYKKPIPKYPRKIGVATSNMGAAVEDIKNITKRRYPLAEIVICSTVVQGEQAGEDIVKSIKLLDSIEDIDLIIVGRGGGSIEDLWAFNLEIVARAVFNCKTPIISAVGHETDFTICDFVADLRAPTPSAAAELAVPDSAQLETYFRNAGYTLKVLLNRRIENEYQAYEKLVSSSILSNPDLFFENYICKINDYNSALLRGLKNKVSENYTVLANLAGRLDALSPLAVIGRGYTFSMDSKGNLIKSAKELNINDKIRVQFIDGSVNCTVDEVIYEKRNDI